MLELPLARSPSPDVAFAWGSRSTTSDRSPASARQARPQETPSSSATAGSWGRPGAVEGARLRGDVGGGGAVPAPPAAPLPLPGRGPLRPPPVPGRDPLRALHRHALATGALPRT